MNTTHPVSDITKELLIRTHELYKAVREAGKVLREDGLSSFELQFGITQIQEDLEKVVKEREGSDEVFRLIKLCYEGDKFSPRKGI